MLAKLLALVLGLGMAMPVKADPICVPASKALEVPILLYHDVAPGDAHGRFTVQPEDFTKQMQVLNEQGYESITPQQLVDALHCSEALPQNPIMITFDDGHADVYEYALPILNEYGYSAVMYVVGNRAGSDGFLTVDQMRTLIKSGWEIGSHTWSHPDLAELNEPELSIELMESKSVLEDQLGVEIQSLAYPFGSFTPEAARTAFRAGYTNAMGLGVFNSHGLHNRYYLQRREVVAGTDAAGFLELLRTAESSSVDAEWQSETQSQQRLYEADELELPMR